MGRACFHKGPYHGGPGSGCLYTANGERRRGFQEIRAKYIDGEPVEDDEEMEAEIRSLEQQQQSDSQLEQHSQQEKQEIRQIQYKPEDQGNNHDNNDIPYDEGDVYYNDDNYMTSYGQYGIQEGPRRGQQE